MVEIIKADDVAVYEARVTVAADSAPRALDLADTEFSRECRKLGKNTATPHYKIASRIVLAGQGGYQYELIFGSFED